jgi:hypothetical protein
MCRVVNPETKVGELMIEIADGTMKPPKYPAGFASLFCRGQCVTTDTVNTTEQSPHSIFMLDPKGPAIGRQQSTGHQALGLEVPRQHIDIAINGRGEHRVDPLQYEALWSAIIDQPGLIDETVAQW